MWRFEYQEQGPIKCHAIIFNIKIGYIYSLTMSYEEDQSDWLNQMMCALDISDVSTEICCSENKVENLTYGIRSIRQPKVVRVTALLMIMKKSNHNLSFYLNHSMKNMHLTCFQTHT
jgi:hypothetical protein